MSKTLFLNTVEKEVYIIFLCSPPMSFGCLYWSLFLIYFFLQFFYNCLAKLSGQPLKWTRQCPRLCSQRALLGYITSPSAFKKGHFWKTCCGIWSVYLLTSYNFFCFFYKDLFLCHCNVLEAFTVTDRCMSTQCFCFYYFTKMSW